MYLVLSFRRFLAALAVTFLCAAILAVPSANAQSRQGATYQLGSGDEVRVTVFGHKDLSGEFTVDGSGNVSLPLVGNVRAGGLSLHQFETNVITALKPDYLKNPRVSAEVLNYRPFYIIGEVKKPGSYPYVNGMTVVNAVALAGGYTYRARENKLLIVRATDQSRKKEPADHDTLVLPGDVIEIPERFF